MRQMMKLGKQKTESGTAFRRRTPKRTGETVAAPLANVPPTDTEAL